MAKGTAIVTGASRGIGAAIALDLARDGYNVVVNYVKSKEKAEAIAKQICDMGTIGVSFQADVSKLEDCKALVDFTMEKFKTIEVLVNNAGMKGRVPYLENELDFVEKIYQTNLMSVVYCDYLVVRQMVKQNYGKIVTISSVGGIMGFAGNTEYSGGKAALIGRAKALAKEIGKYNITYNIVAPGATRTDMLAASTPEDVEKTRLSSPIGKLVDPQDISDATMYLLRSEVMTGQVISPNGGMCM